ncbi:hypothetical protein M1D47_12375 [Bacillus sp. R1-10]
MDNNYPVFNKINKMEKSLNRRTEKVQNDITLLEIRSELTALQTLSKAGLNNNFLNTRDLGLNNEMLSDLVEGARYGLSQGIVAGGKDKDKDGDEITRRPNPPRVNLSVYFLGIDADEATLRRRLTADVNTANQVWDRACGIPVIGWYRGNILDEETRYFNSSTLGCTVVPGSQFSAFRNYATRITPPNTISVFYVRGSVLADGTARGCHYPLDHGSLRASALIIAYDDFDHPAVLAHELGHALFLRRYPEGWRSDNPSPTPLEVVHDSDTNNIMTRSMEFRRETYDVNSMQCDEARRSPYFR